MKTGPNNSCLVQHIVSDFYPAIVTMHSFNQASMHTVFLPILQRVYSWAYTGFQGRWVDLNNYLELFKQYYNFMKKLYQLEFFILISQIFIIQKFAYVTTYVTDWGELLTGVPNAWRIALKVYHNFTVILAKV